MTSTDNPIALYTSRFCGHSLAVERFMKKHQIPFDQLNIDLIAGDKTDLLFIQFNDVDEAGRELRHGRLQQFSVHAEEAAEDVVSSFAALARSSRVALRHLDRGVPMVVSDNDRVRRILEVLVDNAIKHSPCRAEVQVSGSAHGGSVVIEVSDTGIGIPPDQLATVFDEYVQAERPPADRRHGSGLGLTICRRVVRALGGRISASSREGEGTTFSVHLPRWPDTGQDQT